MADRFAGYRRFALGFGIGLFVVMTAIPSALAVGRVSYYAGNVTFTSPDGSTSYGGTTSLVKRTVNQARREITEIVLQPAKRAGEPVVPIVTHLRQRGTSSTFEARDEGKTFRGTLIFSGPAWKWTHWTYAIELTANGDATGEKLSGEGDVTPLEISTAKLLTDAAGKPAVSIREKLDRVSPVEYEKLKSEMEKP